MATKTIKLVGVSDWNRVFFDNRDMTGYRDAYRECDGAYTLDIDLTPESEKLLKESGSTKDRGRKTGKYKFVRKHADSRYDWAGGPPKVVKSDGTVWDFENDGPIWNGSLLEVDVDVYDTRAGKGTRLRAVKVLKLAAEPERDEEGNYVR